MLLTGNGAFDGVARHIRRQGLVDSGTQPRIAIDITTADPCGYRNFPDEFGKELAPFGILCRFAVLDIGPFTVPCHSILSQT